VWTSLDRGVDAVEVQWLRVAVIRKPEFGVKLSSYGETPDFTPFALALSDHTYHSGTISNTFCTYADPG